MKRHKTKPAVPPEAQDPQVHPGPDGGLQDEPFWVPSWASSHCVRGKPQLEDVGVEGMCYQLPRML